MNPLNRYSWVAVVLLTTGCLGRVSLAPHLNRERELAPDTVAGRHSAVLDRAAAFEKQNEKSRDIYWYRTWRASAMVGLEQYEPALELLGEIQSEMTQAKSPPAQSDRLRMFIYDLEAKALLAMGRPAEALGRLERALPIAKDAPLEGGGDCDRELVLGARHEQLHRVAAAAGERDRSERAKGEVGRYLERWARCVAATDYPGMAPTLGLVDAISGAPVAVAAPPAPRAPPPPVAPPPPASPPPPAAPPPPPSRPGQTPVSALQVTTGVYAPVSADAHRSGINAVKPLLSGPLKDARLGVVIRTDGRHHALKVIAPGRVANVEALVPSLKSMVVFFENTRTVKPSVTYVLIDAGGTLILASKDDVFDLFLERIGVTEFVGRLRRLP
jgi:hypothetical protein